MGMADSTNQSWYPYKEGTTLGKHGSEGGSIIQDEEYEGGTHITLERGSRIPTSAAFSITCGIYNWLVHTRFFSTEDEAQVAFDKMKIELADIYDAIPFDDDPSLDDKLPQVSAALKDFVKRFP